MTIDLWGLGLQAINVLILIWLLTRVFWRPVAAAIDARQKAAQSLLGEAGVTKAKADAAMAEVATARDGIKAERAAALAEAAEAAQAAAKQALAEASAKADSLKKAAQIASSREAAANRIKTAEEAAQLAAGIAEKLLARLDKDAIQTVFLELLTNAIDTLPAQEKAAFIAAAKVDLASPVALSAVQKATITKSVGKALGQAVELSFLTEPNLIAGFDLRSAHVVLRNSWRADIDAILEGVKNAA